MQSLPKAKPLTEILNDTTVGSRAEDQAAVDRRRAEKEAERARQDAKFALETRQWHERRAAAINLVNLCRMHVGRDTVTDNDSLQLWIIEAACEAVINPSIVRITPVGFKHEATRAAVFGLAAVEQAVADHKPPPQDNEESPQANDASDEKQPGALADAAE